MADPRSTLQTLDRGLWVLEHLASHPDGVTTTELAAATGLHRTICTRLLGTLAARHYVTKGSDNRYRLGSMAQNLAAGVVPQLMHVAAAPLAELAQQLKVTAHLSIAEADECVAVLVVEPVDSVLHVTYRRGSRHPLSRGAAGHAILAAREPAAGDPAFVRTARRKRYAHTVGEIEIGASGIAAPVHSGTGVEAAVGVVSLLALKPSLVARHVVAAADRISGQLRGPT